jgi:hypothetical protein
MQKLENMYHNKDVGLQDVPVLHQVRASEEVAARIDATIDAFFAGKAKAIGPVDGDGEFKKYGNDIAHSGKARTRVAGKDPDNPKKIVYRFEETKATDRHILVAVFNTRGDGGSVDDLDGNAIKPWVHLVFEDGSQVDLLAVDVPKAAKAKTEKATA